MDHEKALNIILSNACPVDWVEDDYVFELDLHCTIARVTARLAGTVGSVKYDIVSVEFK